jgi:hypothetical protein
MDAVVIRSLVSALHSQERATLRLVEATQRLADKIDAMEGRAPDPRPEHHNGGAMGDNGR